MLPCEYYTCVHILSLWVLAIWHSCGSGFFIFFRHTVHVLVSVSPHWILLIINVSVHIITSPYTLLEKEVSSQGCKILGFTFLCPCSRMLMWFPELLAKKMRIYRSPSLSTEGFFFLKALKSWPCEELFYLNASPFRRGLTCFLSLMQILLKGVSMDTDINRKWKTAVLLSDPQEFLTVAMAKLTDVAGIVLHNLI